MLSAGVFSSAVWAVLDKKSDLSVADGLKMSE